MNEKNNFNDNMNNDIDKNINNDNLNSSEKLEQTYINNASYKIGDEDTNSNTGYTETMDFNNYKGAKEPKVKKVKKAKKPRGNVGSYVAIALVCSILGGGIGGVTTYSIMNSNNKNVKSVAEKKNQDSSKKVDTTQISSGSYMNIPDIAEKVSPAVVGVATKSVATNFMGWQTGNIQEGIGSGFIFNDEGQILTNYHVVKGATEVSVIFSTGQEVAAKVVNYSEEADLAVVKIIDPKVEVPGVLSFGDSDNLKVGEQVMAIGSPISKDFSGSVTTGIVSAVNREIEVEEGKTLKLIQTDTAINPGNSGGPLINSNGEVIGINTVKINAEGVEGLGFSIPINEAIAKLDVLTKPILKLGIQCRNLDEELASRNNLPVGIYIAQVEDFSVAQKAGLKPGDVVVKFDGKKVATVAELNKIKETHKENDEVTVEFVRDGKTMTATMKLEV